MGDMLTNKAWEEANARADMVIRILQDWADWNRRYVPRIGYSPKSAGFQTGGAVSDGEPDYSSVDQARYEIVDTCVDELPPDQRSAIHHRYLCAVYRMRNYADSLARAHYALLRAFVRKGAMW